MARHNRDGQGTDQRGFHYGINYQPDWLRLIKVTRTLETGRQSTKTLFRNPADQQEASPGGKVRTGISCPDQDLDFEVMITDPSQAIRSIHITYQVPSVRGSSRQNVWEEIEFTLEDGVPTSSPRSRRP